MREEYAFKIEPLGLGTNEKKSIRPETPFLNGKWAIILTKFHCSLSYKVPIRKRSARFYECILISKDVGYACGVRIVLRILNKEGA